MNFNALPSRLLENAVDEFAKLPGIGKKTALRLVLHLLKQDKESVHVFAASLKTLVENVQYCSVCHNISDSRVCTICSDKSRNASLVCVVETIKDIMAIENTSQYRGLYHVLGGVISPMDGIGPDDLSVDLLEERLKTEEVKEIIFALSSTMEGDTTNFYLYRKLQSHKVTFTTLARGVAFGDELEYADEITLGRSIQNRTPFSA